jgi:hypothetical protein
LGVRAAVSLEVPLFTLAPSLSVKVCCVGGLTVGDVHPAAKAALAARVNNKG